MLSFCCLLCPVAGIVLTVVTVDANVLINERIREELKGLPFKNV